MLIMCVVVCYQVTGDAAHRIGGRQAQRLVQSPTTAVNEGGQNHLEVESGITSFTCSTSRKSISGDLKYSSSECKTDERLLTNC